MIAFMNPGNEDIIDRIFLSEIDLVQDMAKFNRGVDAASFSFVIMITTSYSGFNGGRTYYLQAESNEDCTELASQISQLARIATKKAEAHNTIGKIRMHCRKVYDSPYFQGASALLILAVSSTRLRRAWTVV